MCGVGKIVQFLTMDIHVMINSDESTKEISWLSEPLDNLHHCLQDENTAKELGIETVSQSDKYQRICFIEPSLELCKLLLLFLCNQKHEHIIRNVYSSSIRTKSSQQNQIPAPSINLNSTLVEQFLTAMKGRNRGTLAREISRKLAVLPLITIEDFTHDVHD